MMKMNNENEMKYQTKIRCANADKESMVIKAEGEKECIVILAKAKSERDILEGSNLKKNDELFKLKFHQLSCDAIGKVEKMMMTSESMNSFFVGNYAIAQNIKDNMKPQNDKI